MKTGSLHLFSVMFQSTPNLIFVQFELWRQLLFSWFPCPYEPMKATKFLYVLCGYTWLPKRLFSRAWFYFLGHKWNTLNLQSLPWLISVSILYIAFSAGNGVHLTCTWAAAVQQHCLPLPNSYPRRVLATAAYCPPDQANQGSMVCSNR